MMHIHKKKSFGKLNVKETKRDKKMKCSNHMQWNELLRGACACKGSRFQRVSLFALLIGTPFFN